MGSREQGVEDLTTNAMTIWNRVTGKLERGAGNIRSCYIKTSMGPSIKVKVVE
jgi:large subunit ribosomal protein L1